MGRWGHQVPVPQSPCCLVSFTLLPPQVLEEIPVALWRGGTARLDMFTVVEVEIELDPSRPFLRISGHRMLM
jgi:hypothetical protein